VFQYTVLLTWCLPSHLCRIIAVLLDTKGPEIRTGFFAEGNKIDLVKGETIVLTSDYAFKGDAKKLACSYTALAKSVTPGQQILVADGSLVLVVLSCDIPAGEISCRIENNATIGERKNMNLPGVIVDLPTLTEKDIDDIVNFGIKYNVDFIAASFVRKGSDVRTLRKLLAENGGQHIKIICKIENQEGLDNFGDILEATDSIMVARGDLGMEIPPSKVFLAQKMMIRESNIAGKPVITATQMLESMITNPRPTRAECSDVANAVYDGTDCVMLSGETANGPYFEQAVSVMARTCVEAESSRDYNNLYQAIRNSVGQRYKISAGESLASSAVKTAIDIDAKFMVVLSETGTTARLVAKFRPGCFVICLTPNETVARQCSGIYKGVHAYTVDSLEKTDELMQIASSEAIKAGLAKAGDKMVVVCGKTYGAGANDQIKVEFVTDSPAPSSVGLPAGHLKKGFSFSGLDVK
jgi:pyruvate kinase